MWNGVNRVILYFIVTKRRPDLDLGMIRRDSKPHQSKRHRQSLVNVYGGIMPSLKVIQWNDQSKTKNGWCVKMLLNTENDEFASIPQTQD